MIIINIIMVEWLQVISQHFYFCNDCKKCMRLGISHHVVEIAQRMLLIGCHNFKKCCYVALRNVVMRKIHVVISIHSILNLVVLVNELLQQ